MSDPYANLTAELGEMSVVLDMDGYAWQKLAGGWRCTQRDLDGDMDDETLYAWYGISRLLWRAEED